MKNQYYKTYESIIIENKKVLLLKPIVFLIMQDNDGYYFQNDDLNIISAGNTFENAEKDMYDEFIIQWELYAKEDDVKLTSKAQTIKKRLLESVKL